MPEACALAHTFAILNNETADAIGSIMPVLTVLFDES
jgi:hypothetical protein